MIVRTRNPETTVELAGPMSAADLLDVIEADDPGPTARLSFGFLDRQARVAPQDGADRRAADLRACAHGSLATVSEVGAFCRQQERIRAVLPLLDAEVPV